MSKKIILGIVIAAVLSVTAFGAVYAYQKESVKKDTTANENQIWQAYGSASGQDCTGYGKEDCEDCLQEKERIRNSLRYRENVGGECTGQDGVEHSWQHRYEYENQYSEEGSRGCAEKERYKSRNENNGNGRGRK